MSVGQISQVACNRAIQSIHLHLPNALLADDFLYSLSHVTVASHEDDDVAPVLVLHASDVAVCHVLDDVRSDCTVNPLFFVFSTSRERLYFPTFYFAALSIGFGKLCRLYVVSVSIIYQDQEKYNVTKNFKKIDIFSYKLLKLKFGNDFSCHVNVNFLRKANLFRITNIC